MDQVGRYQILEELGRGAHGVVYKALDPAIGRTIAIKAIALGNINEADRGRVREGILREAKLAGTLSHPNIVTVYDVMDSGDSAYICMEFVDGKSMEQAIAAARNKQPNKLSRAAFLSVFRQVAEALDYAHRKGVIHRDVKPANIVLSHQRSDGTVVAKIADFGVAKFSSHEVTQQVNWYPALIGTPSYMSPEQVQGAPVTAACDQFSLAVIAYEVLCGQKAFEADSLDALLYRISHDKQSPAHEVNPALSTTVTKVLQRALAKDPEQRFGSCGEFAGALEFALGDSLGWEPGVVGEAADRTTPAEPVYLIDDGEGRPWGRRLAVMAGLCLMAIVAIVMVVGTNSAPPIAKQVLETKNAPVAPPPPPTVEELKVDRRTVAPQNSQAIPDNSPTIVNVPVPEVKMAKKQPAIVRPVKQMAVSGDVQLLTDPPGASVMIDGVNSCTTPCSVTLAGGRHTLAARMDGYGIARKIFYVPADKDIFLPMEKSEGILLVSSEPSGASVSVDGRPSGSTPVTLRLTPGMHRVGVWDGSQWHDQNILVSAGQVNTRLFRF